MNAEHELYNEYPSYKLPNFSVKTKINNSPHVVILGAGASYAAFPNGDRNQIKLPLMKDLVDVIKLKPIMVRHSCQYNGENFEDWYNNLASDRDKNKQLISDIENAIESYFIQMKLPNEATIYDHLILSLRRNDVIATFNWDPFLGQAFARSMNVIGFDNMPQIFHLHGNVGTGVCYECTGKPKGYGWRWNTCMVCNRKFDACKLLYPTHQKNYTEDPFISDQWRKLKDNLNEAYLITIFGYSAPKTDVAAVDIMREAWAANGINTYSPISIIDIKSKAEIERTWSDFCKRRDYIISADKFFDSYLAKHPRRSCEAWVMATQQQDPWKEHPFSQTTSLSELQSVALSLVKEEENGCFSGQYNLAQQQ